MITDPSPPVAGSPAAAGRGAAADLCPGTRQIATAPASGIAPVTVSQGKLDMIYSLTRSRAPTSRAAPKNIASA